MDDRPSCRLIAAEDIASVDATAPGCRGSGTEPEKPPVANLERNKGESLGEAMEDSLSSTNVIGTTKS